MKLADYYNTCWVEEYARAYIDQLNRPYQKHDLDKIARGQLDAEKKKSEYANDILICDTNLIVIKIWSDYKYGSCSDWILEEISKSNYNLHLLTYIDIPWKEDPQREHPDKRDFLYMKYKEELEFWGFKYTEIKGNMNERVSKAVSTINALL
jgi:nicotinamide riboside kinase